MKNLLVKAVMPTGFQLLLSQLFTMAAGNYAGTTSQFELPLTGGSGPAVVTVIGLSLAGISMIVLFLKMRAGRKSKGKSNMK